MTRCVPESQARMFERRLMGGVREEGEPIPAATVFLVRDGEAGVETLMLRKNSKILPPSDPAVLIEQAPFSASLRALARRGEAKFVRKGAQLIIEGDSGDTLFIVVQGKLRACSVGTDGRDRKSVE